MTNGHSQDRCVGVVLSSHEGWPEEAAIVDQGLDDANAAAAPLHEVVQFSCIARSETGQVIGGALGRSWGACCELQQLWVQPKLRRAGIGSRLVLGFEQLAREKGCTSVYLETFSFQAPGLYSALGYDVEYERHRFPRGIVKFHMLKQLAPSAEPACGAIGRVPSQELAPNLSGSDELSPAVELPAQDFNAAARAVLAFLHKRLGFKLWMVTRAQAEDWIVLESEDHGYDVAPGKVFRWADSFCSEMVKGHGPRIAPESRAVPAYAAAPIGQQIEIGAYVGVPLVTQDGTLFGTLCAIDPSPQPSAISSEQELVDLLASMLSTVLQADLKAAQASRELERCWAEAQTDALTALLNRRAWTQLLDKEEERCRRYGHPAAVLMIDLDELKMVNDTLGHEAGDELLVRAANALRSAAREIDLVARLGGDEFAVLAVECDAHGAQRLAKRVRQCLRRARVTASVGLALRGDGVGLSEAAAQADQRMYEEKRSRSVLRYSRP